MMPSYGKKAIEDLLPHRGEALFLDDAVVEGSHVSTHATWTDSHPHLAGHFPGLPIVPGVFLIEAAAQSAGVLLASLGDGAARLGLLSGVRKSLIHRPVRPGERICFELDVKQIGDTNFCSAVGKAHNEVSDKVLTVELTVAIVMREAIER